MVNHVVQQAFEAIDFDQDRFNLHVRPDPGSPSLVVLVHGLGGKGYASWGGVPRQLFNRREDTPVDLAIFDYPSGLRRLLLGGTTDFDYWSEQLRERLTDIEDQYRDIFLVGHSLGGLVIEDTAMKYLGARAMERTQTAPKLAGLIVVASPRAGSGWAVPGLRWLISEFRVLRRLPRRSARVDRFFSTYVERHNVAVTARPVVLPMYAALAGRDRLVNTFSATFGIPQQQQRRFTATHSSIVRSPSQGSELVEWMEKIMRERLEVRAQADRERRHSEKRRSKQVEANRDRVVTEFRSDPSGLQWEEIYHEARRAAATTSVAVWDTRDIPEQAVDLLIAVNDAELVLTAGSSARPIVEGACKESAGNPQLSVGISPVGNRFRDAEATVNEWLHEIGLPRSVYVNGAPDPPGLLHVLVRWLQLVISRNPKQPSAEDALDVRAERTYDYLEGGD